jgi:hypothetical protein
MNVKFPKGRHHMSRKTLMWFVVAIVIAIMLGGASMIVEKGARTGGDAPSGLIH